MTWVPRRRDLPWRRSPVFSAVVAAVAVGGATLLFLPGRDVFAKGQWGLVYLLVTVSVAYATDAFGAVVAAALAFLAWDWFFLPPFGEAHLEDPKDLVTLVVFLVVAVVLGLRTAALRRSEAQSRERASEARALGDLASALLATVSVEDMAAKVLAAIDDLMKPRAAALFIADPEDGSASYWLRGDEATRARIGAEADGLLREAHAVSRVPEGLHIVGGAEGALGVLYVPAEGGAAEVQADSLTASVAALTATFIEHARLRRSLASAEAQHEADRLRNAFVSSVSHELKTPLASANAIVTGLLIGESGQDADRVRSELEAAAGDLRRLETSIGDMLDASRLESQSWRGRPERFTLGEVIGSVVDGLRPADRKRIELEVPVEMPEVCIDFAMVSRALRNIVDNAMLYAQEGKVIIGTATDEGRAAVWVQDEGPGIAEEELELVFHKFYRGEAATASTSGTGLGLHVAREVALLHGGTVRAERVEAGGTRVTFELPVGGSC